MTESDIERDILQLLTLRGFLIWKTHDSRHRPVSDGIPDLMALKAGKFYGIELKADRNRPTKKQDKWLQDIVDHGGVAVVAYSLDDIGSIL